MKQSLKTNGWAVKSLLPILIFTLIYQGCIYDSIESSYCCSTINEFSTPYEWVCPAEKCPGGLPLNVKIDYMCVSSSGFISDRNLGYAEIFFLVDGIEKSYAEISSELQSNNKINYESKPGGFCVLAKESAIIRLKVKCEEFSNGIDTTVIFGGTTTEMDLKINVVSEDSKQELCFQYKAAPDFTNDIPKQGSWINNYDIFGPGVVIEAIQNTNGVAIDIQHDGVVEKSIQPGAFATNAFYGKNPNGMWIIDIPNKSDFINFLMGGKELCLIVHLTCYR